MPNMIQQADVPVSLAISSTSKPRNPLHDHPLPRKGGVHAKLRKAERQRDKQALRKAWFSLSVLRALRQDHACTLVPRSSHVWRPVQALPSLPAPQRMTPETIPRICNSSCLR
jgi:hypothetical protein